MTSVNVRWTLIPDVNNQMIIVENAALFKSQIINYQLPTLCMLTGSESGVLEKSICHRYDLRI